MEGKENIQLKSGARQGRREEGLRSDRQRTRSQPASTRQLYRMPLNAQTPPALLASPCRTICPTHPPGRSRRSSSRFTTCKRGRRA